MADMVFPRNRARWWVAVGLLGVLGSIFVSLGQWQLGRADLRRQMAASIEAGRQAPAVVLDGEVNAAALQPWRSGRATGHWANRYSVLLDNRNLDGKPGLWLATPLILDDQTAVLVLRGWVARPIGQYNALPVLPDNHRPATVRGELFGRVPEIYALGEDPVLSFEVKTALAEPTVIDLNQAPRQQNLSLEALSKASGLRFLPTVLMQTEPDELALARQWPGPSIDADKNTGYAMQWFGFAAIAFGAMGALLWRLLRRAKIS